MIIGIDPGANGGIAWIGRDGVGVEPIKGMTERDIYRLLFGLFADSIGEPHCYIEHVHSSPQMGVKSAFSFGQNYGTLRMAVIAAGIPLETVSPAKWQGDLKCRTKGDKNVTKRKAQELFPQIKVTHAIADALLIAEWGRLARG